MTERAEGSHAGVVGTAAGIIEDVDDPYRWMTSAAAAQRLGMSLRWLYRAIDRGQLPGYRIDGQIRLRRHEVERFRACPASPGGQER